MKIGLVSDTHMFRFAKALPRALVQGFEHHRVSVILHMGDLTDPRVVEQFEALAPFEAVAGNNDPEAIVERFGRQKIVEFGGVRMGLVHGDGTGGTTLHRAQAAFSGDQLDAILFGHSHNPHCQKHGRQWMINPGSPTDKRRNAQYSYGIVEIRDGVMTPSLYYYDDKTP